MIIGGRELAPWQVLLLCLIVPSAGAAVGFLLMFLGILASLVFQALSEVMTATHVALLCGGVALFCVGVVTGMLIGASISRRNARMVEKPTPDELDAIYNRWAKGRPQ